MLLGKSRDLDIQRSFQVQSFSDSAHGLTVFREPETMAATVSTPMITPNVLRARSLDEPGAGMLHVGFGEGVAGRPAVLP